MAVGRVNVSGKVKARLKELKPGKLSPDDVIIDPINGSIYKFHTSNNRISKYIGDQEDVVWTINSDIGTSISPLALAYDDIFISNKSQGLRRLDPLSGVDIWSIAVPSISSIHQFYPSFILSKNKDYIYYSVKRNSTFATAYAKIRLSDGNIMWHTSLVNKVVMELSTDETVLYSVDVALQKLVFIDTENGSIIKTVNIPTGGTPTEFDYSISAISDYIYVKGGVICKFAIDGALIESVNSTSNESFITSQYKTDTELIYLKDRANIKRFKRSLDNQAATITALNVSVGSRHSHKVIDDIVMVATTGTASSTTATYICDMGGN